MVCRMIRRLCFAFALVAAPRSAFAEEAPANVASELPPELEIEPERWRLRGGGVHPYVEGGIGGLYAPDIGIVTTEISGDTVSRYYESFQGPVGLLRAGINVGLAPAADLQLGVGSFLGGAMHSRGDIVFAYPHAAAHVSVGPGEVYRVRVGVILGAMVPAQPGRIGNADAYFGFHGEVSPLVLRFGPEKAIELSITQGLGLFGPLATSARCDVIVIDECVVAEVEGTSKYAFAGHTTLGFGGVF